MYYRQGGAHAYSSVVASKIDSVNFRATIPAEAVTIRGVEGYFERKTSTATFTDPMVDPVNNPRTAIVKFTQAASNITLAPREYTMISVPATLDKPKVHNVLHDDLGAASPSSWRFFSWKDSSYAEYFDTLSTADSTLFRFQKGNAFWVITAEEKTFDVETGYSTPLDSLYRLNLRPRWNMVGSPFAFPVSWDDCALSSSVLGTLYYYAGASEGYRLDWPVLEPWRGYWICNFGLESETLFIPPRASQVQKGTAPQNGVLYALEEKDWLWQISAKTDRTKDLDNFAGVRDGARDEWDVKDRAEPPPIGDYLALYFDHRKWESYPGLYGVDIRKPGQQGYIWEFVVESCEQEKNVSLEWTLRNTYPEGWEAYLIDTDEGVSVNMQQTVRYLYTTDPAVPNTHRFKLLAGSPEFVEQASDVPLVPVAFGLSQNYPNPFNPETTIEYSLPKNGQVRLTVYNIIGQQVRVLVDEKQKTGAHKVMWNGTSENGVQVPSGIYIYRLEFPGKVADRKLVLVR